jgi:hypothetical protein
MSDNSAGKIDGPLAEFSSLRAEIIQAMQMQWNSFALQLTATAAVFSFSLTGGSRTGFLLYLASNHVRTGELLRRQPYRNAEHCRVHNDGA